jgi:hypothetical protein
LYSDSAILLDHWPPAQSNLLDHGDVLPSRGQCFLCRPGQFCWRRPRSRPTKVLGASGIALASQCAVGLAVGDTLSHRTAIEAASTQMSRLAKLPPNSPRKKVAMHFWKRRPTTSREARYLADDLPPASDRPSTLHFTLHKCASVYLREKLHALAEMIGLVPLDFDSYFFDSAKPEPFEIRPRGYFYGPFRAFDRAFGVEREWPDLTNYKVIVVIRDPRDVLTSLYFSTAYSHQTPKGEGREAFLALRDKAQHVDIDTYVRAEADVFLERYRAYFELASRYDVHLTTYEALVSASDAWLDTLLAYLGVELSTRQRRQLVSADDFVVKREDPSAHVRQVKPGDHARKLQRDTIAWLDEKFAEVLAWYADQRRRTAA